MRTVVYSEYFERQAASLSRDIRRLNDVLEGIEWSISRFPEIWTLVPGTSLRAAKTEPAGDIPGLLIYFTIDNEMTCTLQGIALVTDPEDDF